MMDPRSELLTAIRSNADRRPDAPVLLTVDTSSALSYRELLTRVSDETAQLVNMGVGRGDRVAVMADRSIGSVVAMLATMAAGAVTVPIDPAFPTDRLAFMVADSGAVIVRGQIPAHLAGIDADLGVVTPTTSVTTSIESVRGLTPAMILYTSGTTGRPKGVVLSHEGLVGHMWAYADRVGLNEHDRVLQFCSPSSDISMAELLVPLVTGGSVVLRPVGNTPSVDELLALLQANQITWLDLPCAYWQQLAHSGRSLPASVGVVVVGGDRITSVDVADWARANGTVRLVNGYGPTESSITTMMHEVDLDVPADAPIGTPLGHIAVRVVTTDGRPAVTGEPGELVLSGLGVAVGYHDRPEETAHRFRVSPVAPFDVSYATGDLVRVDKGGVFHFVGRTDDQVKISGFRVEPQEVESVAREIGGVTRAVAVVRGATADDRSLALFLEVSGDDRTCSEPERSADQSLVDGWRAIYDDNARTAEVIDPTFNIHGWRNSADNAPIPPTEMHEWVDETIRLIGASRGDEVLEIGCGTGLLLHPLAPDVARYVGTDFSVQTLDVLSRSLDPHWDHVELRSCEAADLSSIDDEFDIVVINSVTQHFPSESYLRAAISEAVSKCRSGGRVIIGDVRGRHLLTTFHADVLAQRRSLQGGSESVVDTGSSQRSTDELAAAKVEADMDEELVVAPQWFAELARGLDRVTHLTLTPKVGTSDNEMVRFRFDVVLEIDRLSPRQVDRWACYSDIGSLDAVAETLEQVSREGERMGLVAVPNARTIAGSANGRARAATVPAELERLARDVGLRAEISWLASGADGSFDVVFSSDGLPSDFSELEPRWTGEFINAPLCISAARRRHCAVVERVRDHLSSRLPAAVVPTSVEVLPGMPITPGGKVDRAELARLAQRPSVPADRTGGAGSLVNSLVLLASEILGRTDMDGDTDFFAAGGTSLAAMRLVARIRADRGVELSPSAVFDAATMAGLATQVGRASYAGPPPGRRADRVGAVPLSATQQRLWLAHELSNDEGRSLIIPAMTLVRRTIAPAEFERACRAVGERHEVLRARICFDGRDVAQRFDVDADRTDVRMFPADDLESAETLMVEHSFDPFEVDRGPLVRYMLVNIADGSSLVGVAIHHVVSDAAALRIVVHEVIMDALGPPRPSPYQDSEQVGIDFGDVAEWERTVPDESLPGDLEAWRAALALSAPTTVPGNPGQAARSPGAGEPREAAVDFLGLSAEVLAGVDRVAEEMGTTRFGVLLAAHLFAMRATAGGRSVATALPVSGRNAVELEPVVGPLIKLVVVATELDAGSLVSSALRQVHHGFVSAIGRQRVPYVDICAAAPASWKRTDCGIVDSMAQYLDLPVSAVVDGVSVTPLDDPGVVTRFGLELIFEQRGSAVRLRLTSAPDRVDQATARAHGVSIRRLLQALPGLLDQPLGRLMEVVSQPEDGGDVVHGIIDRRMHSTIAAGR